MTKLLLLPHCLQKEQQKELTEFSKKLGFKAYTVGGGAEAIAKVNEHKPKILVAIACKREIKTGIEELKGKPIKIYGYEIKILEPRHKTKVNIQRVKKLLGELK